MTAFRLTPPYAVILQNVLNSNSFSANLNPEFHKNKEEGDGKQVEFFSGRVQPNPFHVNSSND